MGQRHQVYFRLPKKFYNKDNCNNRPEVNVGWHNQWSYGSLPLRNVLRVVEYMRAHYDSFKGAVDYIDSDNFTYVMSYDAESQNVSRYYPMGKVQSSYGDALDRQTDENDVLEDPRLGDNNDGITVLDFTPCLKGLPPTYCFMFFDHDTAKTMVPLSAAEYFAAYYNDANDAMQKPADADAVLAKFEGLKMITPARLKKIFPKMFAKKITKNAA